MTKTTKTIKPKSASKVLKVITKKSEPKSAKKTGSFKSQHRQIMESKGCNIEKFI
jgi:hypothetical protein